MKRKHLFLLSVLTGLLLFLAWPVRGFPFILLFAFVPLLFIEDYLCKNKQNNSRFVAFGYAYLSFIIWNALTTWWIYNSTSFGVIMAVVFNSLFMALVFFLFHVTRRNIYSGSYGKGTYGYVALIAYWISFEYFHLNWDLSWSWLNLGNGFSEYYKFIQWYEFTGTLGGTFWILLSNILLYLIVKILVAKELLKRKLIANIVLAVVVITFPIIASLIIYSSYKETDNPVEILVVQPNIDPYNEKFSGMTTEEQIEKMLNLARKKITHKTGFIVAPETAMPEGVWLDELNYAPSVKRIRKLLEEFPDAAMVIGATTFKMYNADEESATARVYPGLKSTYDVFNSALYIDTTNSIQVYHKSKLVPGVEKMPYPQLFGFLEKFAIDLGGMSGSHGVQKERTTFKTKSGVNVAPVICYESIYGDFVNGYVRNEAHLIFIITNDGWWGNTPGYRQHNSYARLRAIETRRSIARSANTGISSFLNQRGDMIQKTLWWEPEAISQTLNANDKITFYVQNGDYFGRILSFLSLLIILFTFVTIFLNRRNYKKA